MSAAQYAKQLVLSDMSPECLDLVSANLKRNPQIKEKNPDLQSTVPAFIISGWL